MRNSSEKRIRGQTPDLRPLSSFLDVVTDDMNNSTEIIL
jgi:hypothetical protein